MLITKQGRRAFLKFGLLLTCLLSTFRPGYAQQWGGALQYGPSRLLPLLMLDSSDASGEQWNTNGILSDSVSLPKGRGVAVSPRASDGFFTLPSVPSDGQGIVSTFTFTVDIPSYQMGSLCLLGMGRMSLFYDGWYSGTAECLDSLSTEYPVVQQEVYFFPGRHEVAVRVLSLPGDTAFSFRPVVLLPGLELKDALAQQSLGGSTSVSVKRPLCLKDMMEGPYLSGVSVSPDGKYALVRHGVQREDRKQAVTQLRDQKGRVLQESSELNDWAWVEWEPAQLFTIRSENGSLCLVTRDVLTGQEQVQLRGLPDHGMLFTKGFTTGYYMKSTEGPEKDRYAIRRLSPDDRQSGWRERQNIYRYDPSSGLSTPVTFGTQSIYIADINGDGSKLLLTHSQVNYAKFPYYFTTHLIYHSATGQVDTLILDDPAVKEVYFIPGNDRELLVVGSPEAFDGVGKVLPAGQVANDYERELFLYSMNGGKIVPLTRDFKPNVEAGHFDIKGNSYIFSAENGSRRQLFRLDLKEHRVTPLPVHEDFVRDFSVASRTGDVWYIGQSMLNADRLYRLGEGSKESQIWDFSQQKLEGIDVGAADDFLYTTPDGTQIDAWYYLPPRFDREGKYPLLVYYYGGTSPVQRTLMGTYSLAMFAAQGYVVLALNPSGTTGYGQEFAARHLNAWGLPTADEIIAATKAFCAEHSYVDSTKIGCFGASYGGFMTQYILTRTNLFAAAISHAGISSISHYWGSGFWGMGYNSVASHGSFPWNRPDLYVKQSPLFNADKIHTPLLLLHGSVDTNVPFSESVNMYNALKVLGREVELIEFTEQDHFILEYQRKVTWTNTMFAWFSRWLQGKPGWWQSMYPDSQL